MPSVVTTNICRKRPPTPGQAWIGVVLCLALIPGLALPTLAQQAPAGPADAESLLPDPRDMARVEAAVDRAMEYLLKTQNADGSWPSAGGSRNGINAFCLLAFLGRGHEPGRGPYRPVVDRAVTYLLAQQQEPNGFFPPTMYDHALVTLALTEAYGFIPSLDMRKRIQRAVDLIVKSQAPSGGWRYSPAPVDQDLSVTVMQVVALRAAQNARLDVPAKTLENAIRFVKTCAAPAGGFGYTGPAQGLPTTAAGTLSLQLLGQYDDTTVIKALDYVKKANWTTGMAYYYYASYYAMQAHFQAGGEYWNQWHPKLRDALLLAQTEDGSWPGYAEEAHNGPAKCYSTAMACMCLEVYMHYLPAYQR